MTARVSIRHETTYDFDRPATIMPHIIRLRPVPHSRTVITDYSLQVEPVSHFIHWQQDPFANHIARLVFTRPARRLRLTVKLTADLKPVNPFDFFIESSAEQYPFQYEQRMHKALLPCLEIVDRSDSMTHWVEGADRQRQPTIEFITAENRRVRDAVDYNIRHEPGVLSCSEVLQAGRGSCRDSSWLLVQTLRHHGIAARFVSGYMIHLKDDAEQAEFSELHAWAEAYIPGAGWIGLDPTSGLLATEGHIPLACAPDPEDTAPVEGNTSICGVKFSYRNELTAIESAPT